MIRTVLIAAWPGCCGLTIAISQITDLSAQSTGPSASATPKSRKPNNRAVPLSVKRASIGAPGLMFTHANAFEVGSEGGPACHSTRILELIRLLKGMDCVPNPLTCPCKGCSCSSRSSTNTLPLPQGPCLASKLTCMRILRLSKLKGLVMSTPGPALASATRRPTNWLRRH